MDEILLVLTNLPNRESAQRVANALIESRAAACINILAECTSVYRWQEKTETASEVPLLIKTTRAAYPQLEAVIHAHHPYELPEIIAVSVNAGLPDYLQWIARETSPTSTSLL
ncbi:Divalent-cation tolerance protein CutA [Candidatus Nitrotoga sp. BS]|uniref:divalent-cation tolerance protein CutA n=1 Tax=Candidatus Nitrotoga sp. BS TaxID=2890408 RepID=UPI001EF1A9A3|nr:divalent-cation tolerance protein CutA [Candidatus Nitrotoga sp. BS]CAH1201203.1 Divalent-cation tolerance protein CutA [Candidatus Nitrotoga sp. BS]